MYLCMQVDMYGCEFYCADVTAAAAVSGGAPRWRFVVYCGESRGTRRYIIIVAHAN